MKNTMKESLFSYNTLVHAVAGSAGSVFALSLFYPLDTVRSRVLLEDRESKNALKIILELVKEEGVETLYRGIIPTLKSLWASNFIFFYTFHGLRNLNHEEVGNMGKDLFFASIAGIVNVILTTPLWVVSTRLKMEGVNKNENRKYQGLLDGLIKIEKEEGVCALWNGSMASVILVSNPAINLMIYEYTKRQIQILNSGRNLNSLTYFLIGAFSKALTTLLTYPLQVVQTKLRYGHNYKDLPSNVGMVKLFSYLIKKQGPAGLYKGMEARMLQTVLTSALMFTTYEKIKSLVFRLMQYQYAKKIII